MAKRRNPFDPKVKKAERQAAKEKKIEDLRKVNAKLHKEALDAENAVEKHERDITRTEGNAAKLNRKVTVQQNKVNALQKKLDLEKKRLTACIDAVTKNADRVTKMKKATAGKQRRCDGKFKRFNSSEDKLSKLTGYHLTKGL
jgi:septal ring factor EnvC (AmiA/AmiB activator)